MKAPDKIYLPEEPDVFFQVEYDKDMYPVEYIRKDALLEWAREKNKRIDTEDGDYSLGYVSAMIDLIEKINAM